MNIYVGISCCLYVWANLFGRTAERRTFLWTHDGFRFILYNCDLMTTVPTKSLVNTNHPNTAVLRLVLFPCAIFLLSYHILPYPTPLPDSSRQQDPFFGTCRWGSGKRCHHSPLLVAACLAGNFDGVHGTWHTTHWLAWVGNHFEPMRNLVIPCHFRIP